LTASQHFRQQIVEYGRRIYQRNFVGGSEGNVSVRFDLSRIMITPSGKCLGYLKPSDMVVLSAGGRKISGRHQQSSEYQLHLSIYHHRQDINAICHAHPIYATALAVTGSPIEKVYLPEFVMCVGVVPLIEYASPGTAEIFEKMTDQIDDHNVFLLQNHGLIALGHNIEEAFNRLEIIERYAYILFVANQSGTPREIPDKLVRLLPGADKFFVQKKRPDKRLSGKKETWQRTD
jgi:L-fuculose-phosphate aldolase